MSSIFIVASRFNNVYRLSSGLQFTKTTTKATTTKSKQNKNSHMQVMDIKNPSLVPTTVLRLTFFILMDYSIHIDTVPME